jgi:hypothetical protein
MRARAPSASGCAAEPRPWRQLAAICALGLLAACQVMAVVACMLQRLLACAWAADRATDGDWVFSACAGRTIRQALAPPAQLHSHFWLLQPAVPFGINSEASGSLSCLACFPIPHPLPQHTAAGIHWPAQRGDVPPRAARAAVHVPGHRQVHLGRGALYRYPALASATLLYCLHLEYSAVPPVRIQGGSSLIPGAGPS